MPLLEQPAHMRRSSKNSGGGIAPAAIGGLIEGRLSSVNGLRPALARLIGLRRGG